MIFSFCASFFSSLNVSGRWKTDLAGKHATVLCIESTIKNELGDERLRFEADSLNVLGQAVIATDINGKIVYWNHAAEVLVGWSRNEMLCKNMQKFFSEFFSIPDPEIASRIWSSEQWTGEVTVKRRDGECLEVIMLKTIISDEGGKVSGVVSVLMDISNLKWMQQITEDALKRFKIEWMIAGCS